MGFRDAAGLHLAGRAKLIMKPAGYQVFPGDVENHFCALGGSCAVRRGGCAAPGHLGGDRRLCGDAAGQRGSERSQLERHARGLAAYMRPHHYVLLDPGQMPLNRVAKADYLVLRERALRETEALKEQGRWIVIARVSARARPQRFSGRVKENTEPRPGWVVNEMVPPCASTIALAMARPMPVPCTLWRWPRPR